ncbi:uncharacterized protein SPPG_09346 [Spizellomyces punctatus DAOM BR117]|uniref:Uncharacterized protein n=1 Tax=Spizellomyces punctatus (strain DAOM BR117) TaxID=645134 RepID=A0A0L0HBU3_SPIPD|nr:uncharacterized protein SPPG_09346 [Spizellomyces punctatus DAOM BR117]KNC98401.1 hypothetical protein SPPG_09346 [Spizellomyces punctatus DAOM BR117]|eukprot:XP_016606441.1 hypothetical protein SPPG_09346 [Spizellomyces punctatus DAOM BR117]
MQGEQTGPSESAPSGRHFTSTGSGVVQANMGPATTMPFTEMNAKKGSQRGRGRYRRGRGRGDSSTALHDSDATGTSTNDSMVQNAATPRPRNTRSARSRRPRPLTDVPNHEVTLGGTALTHSQGNQRRPRIPLTVQGPVQDEAANQETTQSGQTIDGNGAGSRSGEKERKRRPRHKKAPRDASGPVSVSVQGNTDQEGDLTASLIDGLTKGDYECMICYDIVRARDAVWSCHICFAVFHLKCVSKWGRKSAQDALANPASSSSSSNQVFLYEIPQPAIQPLPCSPHMRSNLWSRPKLPTSLWNAMPSRALSALRVPGTPRIMPLWQNQPGQDENLARTLFQPAVKYVTRFSDAVIDVLFHVTLENVHLAVKSLPRHADAARKCYNLRVSTYRVTTKARFSPPYAIALARQCDTVNDINAKTVVAIFNFTCAHRPATRLLNAENTRVRTRVDIPAAATTALSASHLMK